MALKFLYNGIKSSENENKLESAYYWFRNGDQDALMVHATGYANFSPEVYENFSIKNDSDSMTDYFDKDHFLVTKDHVLYNDILSAKLTGDRKALERQSKKFPGEDSHKEKVETIIQQQNDLARGKENAMKAYTKPETTPVVAAETETDPKEIVVEFDADNQLVLFDDAGEMTAPRGLRKHDFFAGLLQDKAQGYAPEQEQADEAERRWVKYRVWNEKRKLAEEVDGHAQRVATLTEKIKGYEIDLSMIGRKPDEKDVATSSLKKTIAKLEKMGLSKADILAAIEELG